MTDILKKVRYNVSFFGIMGIYHDNEMNKNEIEALKNKIDYLLKQNIKL